MTICNVLKGTFNHLARKDFKTIDNTRGIGGERRLNSNVGRVLYGCAHSLGTLHKWEEKFKALTYAITHELGG